jgi:hypothetical protein
MSWRGDHTTRSLQCDARAVWKCRRCRVTLGIVNGERVHIKMKRGSDYFVGFPVFCKCHLCGEVNELFRNG